MSGLVRGVLIALALVVVLVVGVGAYLAANLNDLVREGVELYGPRYTGTDVTLEAVELSLLSGEGELRGLRVGNPQDYEGADPFSLGRVRIALDPASLTEPVILIREITIEEAQINAIVRGLRSSNLQTILDNVKAAAPASEAPTADADSAPLKVIIDRFAFDAGSASVTAAGAGTVDVDIPDIVLTDLGRKTNGETIGEALSQMIGPVVGAIVQAGVDGQLRELLGGRLEQIGDKVREAAGGLLDRLGGSVPFGRPEPDSPDSP